MQRSRPDAGHTGQGPWAPRRVLWSTVGALAIYTLLSFAFFGRPLVHGDREYVGFAYDPLFYVWSLGWWPHAVLNGENPFVTHAMWPVTGFNMAWTAGVPALALAATPVTLLAGPFVAYNAVAVALPAVAAWTAFLLCRYLTGSFWPSLAGGYLFGFSSYMLGHTTAHPALTAVFLVPLVALTMLHYVDGKIGRRGLMLRLGLLLGIQPYLSTEVLATLTVALFTSLVVAFLLVPELRPRLRSAVLPVLGAYVVGAVIAAPLLGYAFADFRTGSINDPARYPADLLNLVIPSELTLLNAEAGRELSREFLGNYAENGAYLGIPLLVVLGWFAWQRRRQPAGRLLVVLLALGVVAELGVALRIAGDRVVTLPWALAAKLPAFNNVLPVRFSMYVALGVSVAAALWAASPRPSRWVRAVVVVAAAVSLAPAVSNDHWRSTPTRVGVLRRRHLPPCFRPEETVFVPDAAGMDITLWQAESGYRFRIANGNLGSDLPEDIPDRDVAFQVLYNTVPEGGGGAVVRLARGLEATVILLDADHLERWAPPLENAGLEAVETGGVWLYHLGPAPPSCG